MKGMIEVLKNKHLLRSIAIVALRAFIGISIMTMLPMSAGAITSQQAKQKKDAAQAQQNKELEKRKKIDAQISEVQREIDAFQTFFSNCHTSQTKISFS